MVGNDNNEVLGVHSKGYVPYQNGQLARTSVTCFISHRFGHPSGGEFGGGKKVFIQLRVMILELVMTK